MSSISSEDTLKQAWAANTFSDANSVSAPLELANFVAGAFLPRTASSPDSWTESRNPRNDTVIALVPSTAAPEVERAIDAAVAAFPAWSALPCQTRSKYLLRVAEIMKGRKQILAVWESVDQGKTLVRARMEVDRAIANFEYFATYILHEWHAMRQIDGVALTYEHRSPKGPFVLISPWNLPLYLLTWKIAPALAFGCTAVAKPSELTSITAFLLADIIREAGLPPGVINIVFGGGPVTGETLVKSPRMKGISFTGGTVTGTHIQQVCAGTVGKKLSLELGGKNPLIVFDQGGKDVMQFNVELTARAAMENQGEICLAASRIYVQSTIYAPFVRALVSHIALTYAVDPSNPEAKLGPVVSGAHFDKVRSYIQLAKDEGGTFALGGVPEILGAGEGERGRGYWVDPTVVEGLDPKSSRVMREEIFGPVITVTPFQTESEAIALANDNPHGLAAVLLARDVGTIRRVSEQLEAGMVWVNCWMVRELSTPFGGMKSSGVGREGGDYSRDVFTDVRTVHLGDLPGL